MQVKKAIEEGIQRANTQAISKAQKVQKFELLEHDFSVPTGELGKFRELILFYDDFNYFLITGPTLKVKRNVVVNMYSNVIEKMYQ